MRRSLSWMACLICFSGAAPGQTPNSVTEYTVPTANSQVLGITAGPDGAIWFTENGQSKIGRSTINGSITEYTLPASPNGTYPAGITTGPDGALWFAAGSNIGRITPTGNIILYPETGGGGAAYYITKGPDGALWFIDTEVDIIGRITTNGVVTTYLPLSRNAQMADITAGPDGALWFTEFGANKIGRITTQGVVTEFPLPNGGGPQGITVGPDNALWFTESTASRIGRITTSGFITEPFPIPVRTAPNRITTGPDGALWFTEPVNGRIGRLTTTGTVTEFTIPTANSSPAGITAGPDGAVWFTEPGPYTLTSGTVTNKIGKIQATLSPVLTSVNPPSATACGPSFPLTMTGSNFQSSTVGAFGDPSALTQLATTVQSNTQLAATVTASLIQKPGTSNVYAATPSSTTAGGFLFSGPLTFLVNPTPVIQQISPNTIKAGTAAQLMLVISNYIPGVTSVRWGNTTGYLPVIASAAQGANTAVTVSVPASLTAAPGPVQVSVVNVEGANPAGVAYSATCSPPQTVTVISGLTITTTALPTGVVGIAYPSTTLQAQGGTTPYFWSATGLPPNLTLSQAGVLSGVPGAAGSYMVTVTLADSSSPQQSIQKPFTLVVTAGLTITTTSLASGSVNSAYPATALQAQGGTLPYTWTATGLPANMTLSPGGTLSGTPNTAGSFTVRVMVADSSAPLQTASQTYTLVITGGLTILTTSLPAGTINAAYPSTTLQAQGGTLPYTWTATGLPANMTVTPGGTLSGTPNSAGSFTVKLVVSDNSNPPQTVSQTYTLVVNAAITITTSSLPAGTVNTAYPATTLQVTGGTPPYTWTQTGLPGGLTLSTSGVLSGQPNTPGVYSKVMITVTDSAGQATTNTYSLTINLPPLPTVQVTASKQPASISDQPSISIALGAAYAYPLTATLTLSFVPNAAGLPATGYTDPGLQFATGGVTATVPAPSGTSALPAIQVGSVAGTITATVTALTASVNGQNQSVAVPSPAPSTQITVPRLAPVIVPGSVKIINVTSTGFLVDLQASSTPRDLSSAALTFTAATGTQLNGTSFTIPLTSGATDWFASANGRNSGSAFDLQIPFTYNGDTTALGAVSVTLTNSAGTSAAVSGGR